MEVADEKALENMSEAEMEEVKRKEGERILSHVQQDTYVITLEIGGKMSSSEQLAEKMDQFATYGKSKVALEIGGSLGISGEVQKFWIPFPAFPTPKPSKKLSSNEARPIKLKINL